MNRSAIAGVSGGHNSHTGLHEKASTRRNNAHFTFDIEPTNKENVQSNSSHAAIPDKVVLGHQRA